MKKILCYGDSNTFGFIPETGARYTKKERWSGILSEILPPNFEIIEEGANNRTGFFKNPMGTKQSGSEYLPVVLKSAGKIDICVLALGTNDAQIFYDHNEDTVKNGMKRLIHILQSHNPDIKIIIVPPVIIRENILKSGFSAMFDRKSIEKIQNTFRVYEQIAKENNLYYFDFNKIAPPSEFDGLHYTAQSHKKIAQNLAKFILKNVEK